MPDVRISPEEALKHSWIEAIHAITQSNNNKDDNSGSVKKQK